MEQLHSWGRGNGTHSGSVKSAHDQKFHSTAWLGGSTMKQPAKLPWTDWLTVKPINDNLAPFSRYVNRIWAKPWNIATSLVLNVISPRILNSTMMGPTDEPSKANVQGLTIKWSAKNIQFICWIQHALTSSSHQALPYTPFVWSPQIWKCRGHKRRPAIVGVAGRLNKTLRGAWGRRREGQTREIMDPNSFHSSGAWPWMDAIAGVWGQPTSRNLLLCQPREGLGGRVRLIPWEKKLSRGRQIRKRDRGNPLYSVLRIFLG